MSDYQMLQPVGGNKVTPPKQALADLDAIASTPTVRPTPQAPSIMPPKEGDKNKLPPAAGEFDIKEYPMFWRIRGVRTRVAEETDPRKWDSFHTVDVRKRLLEDGKERKQHGWASTSHQLRVFKTEGMVKLSDIGFIVPSVPLLFDTLTTLYVNRDTTYKAQVENARQDIAALIDQKDLHTLSGAQYRSFWKPWADDKVIHNIEQFDCYELPTNLLFAGLAPERFNKTYEALTNHGSATIAELVSWLTQKPHYVVDMYGNRLSGQGYKAITLVSRQGSGGMSIRADPDTRLPALGFRSDRGFL